MAIHIGRRELIVAFGGAAAWPLAALAQRPVRMKRVGWLEGSEADDPETQPRLAAFRQALAALGWTEGHNIEIVSRFGVIDPDRNRAYIAELIGWAPDLILTNSPPTISALMMETRTIAIVSPIISDPVALGFAESLAHPGRNFTGFTNFELATAGKWLELLREIAPGVIRIAILVDPRNPSGDLYVRSTETAASTLGLHLTIARARDAAEIAQAIDAFAREPNGGLIVPPSPLGQIHRETIWKLAAHQRLPAVYPWRYHAVGGGLMSYGPDVLDNYRRLASYVDRILKGEKPADLPVQVPTKFELVINLKTAKALGLEVPPTLLARADEVIE